MACRYNVFLSSDATVTNRLQVVSGKPLTFVHRASAIGTRATEEDHGLLPLLMGVTHVGLTSSFHATYKVSMLLLGGVFSSSYIVASLAVVTVLLVTKRVSTILGKGTQWECLATERTRFLTVDDCTRVSASHSFILHGWLLPGRESALSCVACDGYIHDLNVRAIVLIT